MGQLRCCVDGCDATSATHQLFSFPKNDNLRNLWLSFLAPSTPRLIGLSQTQLRGKRVCEKHFDKCQFDAEGKRLRYSYPCLITEKEIIHGVPLSKEGDVQLCNQPGCSYSEFKSCSPVAVIDHKALTWGDERNPPVLLCHGKMDVSSGFRPLVSRLPQSFFYVSVDLPGNGKSDHFPIGGRFTIADFVPTIVKLRDHFKWDKFAYIGHSLGVVIGKYFNIAYPNCITRIVELDPVPAFETWSPGSFAHWYHHFYGEFYTDDKYKKYNGSPETAPKYTYNKALDLMMNTRGLTKEASEHVLERSLEPAGGGLYRFNYDQRLKEIPRLPVTPEYLKQLYTSVHTPTFTILAQSIVELGAYHFVPFIQDPKQWPNGNYKVKVVEGGHDVHINDPECMADDISKFLLEDFKAKL